MAELHEFVDYLDVGRHGITKEGAVTNRAIFDVAIPGSEETVVSGHVVPPQ